MIMTEGERKRENHNHYGQHIQLTIGVSDPNFSSSKSSMAVSLTDSSLEAADVIRNILPYLSNYCKALLILINVIIVNLEKLLDDI